MAGTNTAHRNSRFVDMAGASAFPKGQSPRKSARLLAAARMVSQYLVFRTRILRDGQLLPGETT